MYIHIHTTECEIDSYWEAVTQHGELSSVLCGYPEERGGCGRRTGVQEGGVLGICVCMCMCTRMCVYVICICICVCVYVCVCVYLYVCVCVCLYVCVCVYMYMYVYMYS